MRNNNPNRKSGMKHRHNNGGRRYNNGGGSGGRSQSDHQNLSRQKHHASQMRDKFQALAQDAQRSGERVDAEYYLQHVDHYMRVLADIALIEAERYAHLREQQASATDAEGADAPAEMGAEEGAPDAEQNQRRRMHARPARHYSGEGADAAAPAEILPHTPREIPLPASIIPEISAGQ